jgi:predicted membrane-bound spermidine synthase
MNVRLGEIEKYIMWNNEKLMSLSFVGEYIKKYLLNFRISTNYFNEEKFVRLFIDFSISILFLLVYFLSLFFLHKITKKLSTRFFA